jgi:hypothetical protein
MLLLHPQALVVLRGQEQQQQQGPLAVACPPLLL